MTARTDPPTRFLNITGPQDPVRGLRGHDGKPPLLNLVLPSGRVREVPVDRDTLLRIAEQAIAAVRAVDRKEEAGG